LVAMQGRMGRKRGEMGKGRVVTFPRRGGGQMRRTPASVRWTRARRDGADAKGEAAPAAKKA
jgi:hypothetical protein